MTQATGKQMTSNRDSPIRVLWGADDNYARPLATSVRSVIENANNKSELQITIVDGGITKKNIDRLRRSWPDDVDITFVRVNPERVRDLPRATSKLHYYLTPAMWLRVLGPELRPEFQTGRLIYLDTDTHTGGDLREMYELDMQGHPIAARIDWDPRTPTTEGPFGFNSGSVLYDLPLWHSEAIADQVLQYGREHADELITGDQSALNAVLKGRWLGLDRKWNNVWFALNDRRDPEGTVSATDLIEDGVTHFFTRIKPWTDGYKGKVGLRMWHDIEALTDWANEPLVHFEDRPELNHTTELFS